MKHLRYGILLLALGSALGPLGCPAQPLCPTCGLRLESPESATLSLVPIPGYEGQTLVGVTVTVIDESGLTETHEYSPDQLPLQKGEVITLEDPALSMVGDRPTVAARVTMRFLRGSEVVEAHSQLAVSRPKDMRSEDTER